MSSQPSRMSAVALVLALAMGLAAPACAAGKHKKHGHPRTGMPTQAMQSGAPAWGGGVAGSGPLYFAQEYLGTDPDPGIRFQLMRDIAGRYGGGAD